MTCREYPKIETLFERDPVTFRVDEHRIRMPEFSAVKRWHIAEKIDGTNVRVHFDTELAYQEADGSIRFSGRTANAQMPTQLMYFLQDTFTSERMSTTFQDAVDRRVPVTLFGEGYGPKIQSGGNYRADISVRLFDVLVGDVWLRWESVREIAAALGLYVAPCLGILRLETAVDLVKGGLASSVAADEGGNPDYQAEGIVARSEPLMLDRMGRRIVWKLKGRDFTGGKR